MGFAAYLSHTFEQRRTRNRRYSLRAFARDLGVDHATLSQWMRGTRPLNDDSIERLSSVLGLSPAERAHGREFDPLDIAILEAAASHARPTSTEIARRIGATTDQVNVSLARLTRLRLLALKGAVWTCGTEA